MISLGEVFLITAILAGFIELCIWTIEKVSNTPAMKRRARAYYDDDDEEQ